MIEIDDIREKYGSEIALVVLCCRLFLGTTDQRSLQQFIHSNTIDWAHFKFLADYHRIEPVVFKAIGNIENIPPDIASSIRQKQHYLIHQSFKRSLETERLVGIFTANNIRCIPYKGVVFSKQFYGDFTSRESSDIDFIIHPSDFDSILQLMLQEGYSFEQEYEYAYFRKAIFGRQKEMNFNRYKNRQREFHVEFHWRISDNVTQLKKEANTLLYEKTYKTKLAGEEVLVLNKSAHYLAVFIHHAYNDGFSVIRNLIDLCLPENHIEDTACTQYINDAFSNYQLTKAAALCQHLSFQLLGVHPLFFNNQTKASISRKETHHFTNLLLNKELRGKHQSAQLYNNNILLLKDNSWEKLKYLLACLSLRFKPSSKDLRIFKIPKPFYFLYFILKPIRSLFVRVNLEEEKNEVMKQTVKPEKQ